MIGVQKWLSGVWGWCLRWRQHGRLGAHDEAAMASAAALNYQPLSPEQRLLRILEMERYLKTHGGLRRAAQAVVDTNEQVLYWQAVCEQWRDVLAFKQFCRDMREQPDLGPAHERNHTLVTRSSRR